MRRCLPLFLVVTAMGSACSPGEQGAKGGRGSASPQQSQAGAVTLDRASTANGSTAPSSTPDSARLSAPGPMPFPPSSTVVSEADQQEHHAALLAEAFSLLAREKLDEAAATFERARCVLPREEDNLAVPAHFRLRSRMAHEKAADRLADDIEVIVNEGRTEEAIKLLREPLRHFSDTPAAARLARLARQATALLAVQLEDKKAAFTRVRQEFEAARKQKNLWAAVIAGEQALTLGDDPQLSSDLAGLQSALSQYEQLRARAAELRRSPERLEECLQALGEAVTLSDNLALRREIDDTELALKARRPRLAVADFDVPEDIGVPGAATLIAREIGLALSGEFDQPERDEFAKTVRDLNLTHVLADDSAWRQLGQIARVRYLVIGRVTLHGGIGVQALLIDTSTGFVVQSARVVARTPAELPLRLPQLAHLLRKSDGQKLALERFAARETAVPARKADPQTPVPPAPEAPASEGARPSRLTAYPRSPGFGSNLQPAQFQDLPAPPKSGQPYPALPTPSEREREFRRRLLFVALEAGDDLFQRGRFPAALRLFEFCLELHPEMREVRLRVDRCRPLAPPAIETPVPTPKPRLAVADFPAFDRDWLASDFDYLGQAVAERIGPYFGASYELVDRAEWHWWMGRLGITYQDLITDRVARVYLCRALNVRYVLFGDVTVTAGYDASAYLVDAEYGFVVGAARTHGANRPNLKMRLPELARVTQMPPQERMRFEQQNASWEVTLIRLRELFEQNSWGPCSGACREALRSRSWSVEARVLMQQSEQKLAVAGSQIRTRSSSGQLLGEIELRGFELAEAVEAVRWRVESEAGSRKTEDQRRLEANRELAADVLLRQAQTAFGGQRFGEAERCLRGAAAWAASDDTFRDLAKADLRAEAAARGVTAFARATFEAQQARRFRREIEEALGERTSEERQRQYPDGSRPRAEEDRREAERVLSGARHNATQAQIEAAMSAAQAARNLRPGGDAGALIQQLIGELAKANTQRQGAEARVAFERELAGEEQSRQRAQAEAEQRRNSFVELVAQANRALQEQRYGDAVERLNAARTLFPTDNVLAKLKQAARAKEYAGVNDGTGPTPKPDGAGAPISKAKLKEAQAALDAKQFDQAISLFHEAEGGVSEGNRLDARAGLLKSVKVRDDELLRIRHLEYSAAKQEALRHLLESGKNNLAERRWLTASIVFSEVLALFPGNGEALPALAESQARLEADQSLNSEFREKSALYRRNMRGGWRLLCSHDFEYAQLLFSRALSELPSDLAAAEMRTVAAKKAPAREDQDRMERKRRNEIMAALDLMKLVDQVRDALAADMPQLAAQLARRLPQGNDAVKAVLSQAQQMLDANTPNVPQPGRSAN
jgi:tetratricopeptide (TPR) repeat protein